MLAGLRHHRFVGGHHQQHRVDAADAGQHGAHEAFVTGHIDERDGRAAGQLGMREAELDGDAAGLLFLQPVGVGAGQGLDQRALAVVDVAGGADDDRAHGV